MTIVSNTGPLIALAKVDALPLLKALVELVGYQCLLPGPRQERRPV
jgi:hypothetical protein